MIDLRMLDDVQRLAAEEKSGWLHRMATLAESGTPMAASAIFEGFSVSHAAILRSRRAVENSCMRY